MHALHLPTSLQQKLQNSSFHMAEILKRQRGKNTLDQFTEEQIQCLNEQIESQKK